MRADISEFSYGFALTSELVDCYSLRWAGAPKFPSLLEEGREGGGYDVEIPLLAVFLQFKLSDILQRRNASEAQLLGLPYYRMHLRPLRHSAQHQLLLALEAQGNEVYYVAPEFHTPRELNESYSSRTVRYQSAFFSPQAIGPLPDDGWHYVVFSRQSNAAYFCSKPKEIWRTHPDTLRRDHRERREAISAEAGGAKDFYRELIESMLRVYGEEGRKLSEEDLGRLRRLAEERDPAEYAQYLSQTLFDCELLVLVLGGRSPGVSTQNLGHQADG